MTDSDNAAPGRVHRLGTLLGTVLVVLAELTLLHVVYVYARSVLVADLVYGGLLTVASVGWMVWFRRLVVKHRGLERSVTEERARAVGASRLAALVAGSTDVIMVLDRTGNIDYASPASTTVFGITPDDLASSPLADLVEASEQAAFRLLVDLLPAGAQTALKARMRRADGRLMNVEGTVQNLRDNPAVGGAVVTMRDVTGRVRMEEALTRQAFHDPLTDLPNRQLFADRLDHALLPHRGDGRESLVVLFCDLDEFKNVNDSRGHSVGDEVLVEIGRRASAAVRVDDTVARFGGDEFAVLLEDSDIEQALEIAERLRASISAPLAVDGATVTLGVSIGLVAATVGGDVLGEELLRDADVAMYLAKARGKGTIAVYDAELHAAALRSIEVRDQLARAIEAGDIVPHFQPVLDLKTRQTVGFEALARWKPASGPAVPPGEFIAIAEQNGLIHPLGLAILESACRHGVDLGALNGSPLTMSVNVTVGQLRLASFVDDVLDVLRRTGLPAASLILEITESELALGFAQVEVQLRRLRQAGIRIAIDDFGTGFSSLAYLRDLEVDILKIDKAFVDRVVENQHDSALALAIITLGTSVRLATVAEGVEYDGQAEWLRGTSCTFGQGFLWSPALNPADARAWVVAQRDQTAFGGLDVAVPRIPAASV